MRSYLICDDEDILIGMRLAGIEGAIAKTREETLEVFERVVSDSNIGIVIVTEKTLSRAEEEIMKVKLEKDYPLIIAIPGKGEEKREDYIDRYIRESIGIKV
ncbi:V-type ATP synthase subunit F [Wukongibacter baidiensis]|uniref:V-type ATP synthase subunit F n=1 Tax=Wukongibacter baidiensis TaxID=1723361 RepID=UPI003D7FC24A